MRAATTCDGCGQTDDHPKLHTWTATKHHDCLTVAEREAVTASSLAVADIIDACERGLRGPELLAYIESRHTEG